MKHERASREERQDVVDYTSGESFDNNLHDDEQVFYAGALRNTEGIFENTLGPSGSFVNSHSPPGLHYTDI